MNFWTNAWHISYYSNATGFHFSACSTGLQFSAHGQMHQWQQCCDLSGFFWTPLRGLFTAFSSVRYPVVFWRAQFSINVKKYHASLFSGVFFAEGFKYVAKYSWTFILGFIFARCKIYIFTYLFKAHNSASIPSIKTVVPKHDINDKLLIKLNVQE